MNRTSLASRIFASALLLGVLGVGAGAGAGAAGCKNPAADKPQATVSAPLATPASTIPGATAYVVTPANSKVEWTGSKVTASHDGAFTSFAGNIDYAGAVEKSAVAIDIDLASVTVTPEHLQTHLKSPDFFDVAKFPKASFVSTSITPGGEGGATHTITGNLDLHGVKKSIRFPATISVMPDFVDAKATFSIDRKDFGITYPGKVDDLIRDQVLVKLTLHAERKKG